MSEAAVSSPYVSNAMVVACVLIEGHALIQNLGKPAGCRTFSDYADIFSKSIFSHFSQARVDVVIARYFGAQSIKPIKQESNEDYVQRSQSVNL